MAAPQGSKLKLLAFAGSLRKDSLNKKLIQAWASIAQKQGVEVTLIELNDYELPIYNGDIEEHAVPENVRKLQELCSEHDGFLIASPEYNGAVPALIKNTLDWISRPLENGDSGVSVLKGKVCGIAAASPGGLGGLRALLLLRDQLAKLSLWVAPSQFALSKAPDSFSNGELTNESAEKALANIVQEVRGFYE
ncbi:MULTISPECIES: NADPH-dependent FMN reductase [Gammaproteobacteria]|uniref:NADPH-dependent FMN reductase n=1 Tax=Gammaproteobacteria TaxID=1236 RepID=UPI000DD0CB60|nr:MULTISPECIES: NAD(P)H-dependent oxidoreductase [Gammaproteobacteria]RTE86738.1 NADPH-dependent oxidoreductase [Aliidiomarina sp. B3213]TCZ90708.1 NADPH-dependent oxidoreductase [Lysobacter sp. N42]